MGLVDKIKKLSDKAESLLENIFDPGSSEFEGTAEEENFHKGLIKELTAKYGLEMADCLIISNKLYKVPNYLSKRDQVSYSQTDAQMPIDNPLPTSQLSKTFEPKEQREYAKGVIYGILDESIYIGVRCCTVDEDSFIAIVKNYEGISGKIRDVERRHKWMLLGLELASKQKGSGVLYFSLKSPISNEKMEEFSTAIKVAGISESINLYLKGRIGKNIPLRLKQKLPADFQHLEQTIFTDGKYVYMPQEVNQLPSKELNARYAWRAAGHEAGHITEGSFKIDPEEVDTMIVALKEKYKDNKEVQARLAKKEKIKKKKLEEDQKVAGMTKKEADTYYTNGIDDRRKQREEEKKKKQKEQEEFEESFRAKVGAQRFREIAEKRKMMLEEKAKQNERRKD